MNHTKERYVKRSVLGLGIAVLALWIANVLWDNPLLRLMTIHSIWGLAIVVCIFSITNKKYTKYYNKSLLIILILTIPLTALSFIIDNSILINIVFSLIIFLAFTSFVYGYYISYKLIVKDFKTPRDERRKNNFNRATRNAYVFLVITIFFIPIEAIIRFIYPTIESIWATNALFYISVIIGLISFYYYDRWGK